MRLLSRKAYLAMVAGDVAVLYAALYAALALRHLSLPSGELFFTHAIAFTPLFALWLLVFFLSGLYGRYTLLFLHTLPLTLFIAQTINTAFAVAFFFLAPLAIAPKLVLAWFVVLATAGLYIWRVHIFPRLQLRQEIGAVLIGTSIELSELAEEVNRDPIYPLEFRAIIHPELLPEERLKTLLYKLIEQQDVSVIVADMGNHALDQLLDYLYELCFIKQKARFIDARALYEEVFERVPLSLIRQRWVLRHIPLQEHTFYSISKRIGDVVAGVVLGIVFLLILPFVAAAIYWEDGGDIFYVTKRLGRGGRPIWLLKFRTMNGKDSGAAALASTLQVTRVGAWLRRFRLDEIPQFFNILRGELSLVGPRPEMPALAKEYEARIPFYRLRLMVPPGLTGWAQIQHRHHPHHRLDADATREKLSYDLYYIRHRGIWLDILITARTFLAILKDARSSRRL